MTDISGASHFADPAVASAVAASSAEVAAAGRLGEFVVIMGAEILAPKGKAPNAGRIVHRRFTDAWRFEDGVWRLVLRQATIAKIV